MIPVALGPTTYRGVSYVPNNALSREAQEVGNAWSEMLATLANVASVQPRLNAIRELKNLYTECSSENWDGEGAAPISQETYHEAVKFLRMLPLTIEMPETVPEPNGSIGFEWHRNQRVFVVSVKGKQSLSYAGVFGPGVTARGSEDFIDSISNTVITNLQRLREA